MSHPRTQLQRVGGPDTEDNDRVRHPQTENDRNQKDTDETASWKRRDRPWFALLEFALSVEVPRGIADERDSADRTVTPTGNKTKMNGFVEISTLLIHSAPKQKSNEWMHLSPFYTRMHGEWLRYAKSTSQFHWRFLLVRDVRGFQVNPLCRHDITRSDRQIGNVYFNAFVLPWKFAFAWKMLCFAQYFYQWMQVLGGFFSSKWKSFEIQFSLTFHFLKVSLFNKVISHFLSIKPHDLRFHFHKSVLKL